MQLAPDLAQQIVDHALRDAPNECCGIVLTRDGVAERVHEMENLRPSPLAFEIDVLEIDRITRAAEDEGLDFGAVYHSHTRSSPVPSQTDINFGRQWPGVEWIIVGTKGPEPEVRSWLIDLEGAVEEVPLT